MECGRHGARRLIRHGTVHAVFVLPLVSYSVLYRSRYARQRCPRAFSDGAVRYQGYTVPFQGCMHGEATMAESG